MSNVAQPRRSTGKSQQVARRGEAVKTELLPGERREDRGDEDTQQQQQQQQAPITTYGRNRKEVVSFTCLGSIVSTTGGGTDEDVKARIGEVRQAFISLKSVWRSTALNTKNKIRIFNTNVKSVLPCDG
ncbi:unnamed protein product [Heterobilharzia americana]|nr:unnamed protein product [Heterobilharzia americana]